MNQNGYLFINCHQVVRSANANSRKWRDRFKTADNFQGVAIAVATNGGTAKASQQFCVSSQYLHSDEAIAASCTTLTCDDICDDSVERFNASGMQNHSYFTSRYINVGSNNAAIAGAEEIAIERECYLRGINFRQTETTIDTNCPSLTTTEPNNIDKENVDVQYIATENLDSVLNQTPLSSIKINGKAVSINPQSQTIKQVAFNKSSSKEYNTNKNPMASIDKIHVVLNLEGISLDATVDPDGNVLVDRKGVKK